MRDMANIEALRALRPNQTLPERTRDHAAFSSRIDGQKFIFDSKDFKSDLVFERDQGSIKYSKNGSFVFATIAESQIRVAIALKEDPSRGAAPGDIFERGIDGLFDSDSKLKGVQLDINELKEHFQRLSRANETPAGNGQAIFIEDPMLDVRPQIRPTPNALMGNIQRFVSAPIRFLKDSPYPLSVSHGCIHVSPGDADTLNSYVGVGSRIKVRAYGEKPPESMLPYIEKAEVAINRHDVMIEIYPKPSVENGGVGIVYLKGETVGYFKLTGGPAEEIIASKPGEHDATPTRQADTVILNQGWHRSEYYPDSRIPGGAQVRFDRQIKTKVNDGYNQIEVPTLFYREFNYAKGVYTDKWLKADPKFMEFLAKRLTVFTDSGEINTEKYPFEARSIKGNEVLYYIGSSFGNGEVLPTGERVPQTTFNWGTSEYIHYGGQEEKQLEDFNSYAIEYLKSDSDSAEEFVRQDTLIEPKEKKLIADFLKSIEKQKREILTQGRSLGLTRHDAEMVVELFARGYQNDGEALFASLIEHKQTRQEGFFVDLPELKKNGMTEIDGINVRVTVRNGKTNISLTPPDDMPDDTAFKKIQLLAKRFNQPGSAPATLEAYKRKIKLNQAVTFAAPLNTGTNPREISFIIGKK